MAATTCNRIVLLSRSAYRLNEVSRRQGRSVGRLDLLVLALGRQASSCGQALLGEQNRTLQGLVRVPAPPHSMLRIKSSDD